VPVVFVIAPVKVFGPESLTVPVPALVRLEAPLIPPLTVRALAELFVQVWSAPKATLAAMVLAGTLASMVMPAPPAIVSVLPSALSPNPLVVSWIMRLLMVMLAPRTVAVGAVVTVEFEI